jgi:hypothetical protein
MKYPFPPGPIAVRDAISFVAKVAYPEDRAQVLAKKKVRERIRYASEKRGTVECASTVNPGEFFAWAVDQWPQLATVEDLPRDITVHLHAAGLAFTTFRPTILQIPPDAAALKDAYIECETKRQDLEAEVADLNARNSRLEEELKQIGQRQGKLRKQLSDAGKKGGRGNVR